MFVEYMYEHFEEFKLLVNGSYGTKFQNIWWISRQNIHISSWKRPDFILKEESQLRKTSCTL